MMYSYSAKNTGRDAIYQTRLMLIEKLGINPKKSQAMYSYFMDAYLGVILI